MLSQVSFQLPSLPPSPTAIQMQPDRVRLKRFNYSPGEDESEWLNSLEKVEEDEEEEEEDSLATVVEGEQ